MRRNRLLLPWGLLAGLLIWIAVVEGLNIKPPSLLKKPRNYTTTTTTPKPSTTTTTTTTVASETTVEGEHESDKDSEGNVTTKSPLSGIPQIDYVFDPNLPRELPRGYNLSEYPFFSTVPDDIVFECDGLLDGFYASIFYKCQIYHHCVQGIRYDFLCANYTAFDQRTFICQFVSEVDCVNSAKWWFRNEPLYKGRITTTTTTTTTAPPPTVASTRRPAASGPGRRRRPFRRRRPQYDYYYDDEYDDEDYDDDLTGPGQSGLTGSRQRKRQRRPNSGTIGAADAPSDVEDKPARPPAGGGSLYDRPRVLPKIRRPVPINERDKYEYTPKGGSTDNGGGEKRAQDNKPANEESDRPKRPVESPAAEVEKPREPEAPSRLRPSKQRPAPVSDDDEDYDDEDYDQPIRTSSRKNNQDYYAPSGADRDFSRRPAMSGAGRPLRRNRPGRRKPAPVDYDDDYDDRRPLRPSSALDDRRRPDDDRRRPAASSRKRPSQRDDYDRDDGYDRPLSSRDRDRDTKRPQSSRESTYERPATSSRETTYDRASPSKTDAAYDRTSSKETAFDRLSGNKKRPQSSTREPTYDRPRQERPGSRTSTADYDRPAAVPETGSSRPLASRSRFADDESDEPIPAAKPAYISTTGRSAFRKRGPDEVRGRSRQVITEEELELLRE